MKDFYRILSCFSNVNVGTIYQNCKNIAQSYRRANTIYCRSSQMTQTIDQKSFSQHQRYFFACKGKIRICVIKKVKRALQIFLNDDNCGDCSIT